MKQIDTKGMPPVIYAMIPRQADTQVVVFKTGDIPEALRIAVALDDGRCISAPWTHWGIMRSPYDEPGEDIYLLIGVSSELLPQGHFRLDQDGKYLGSGFGGVSGIMDWTTSPAGVAYRWRKQFESAIAEKVKVERQAQKERVFLQESLELFGELPYSQGGG